MVNPSVPITDTFNRANESPPMTGWATPTGISGLQLTSNQCAGSVAGNSLSYWNTILSSGDCEQYVFIPTKPAAGDPITIDWRMKDQTSIATLDCYLAAMTPVAGTDSVVIQRVDNAVATTLGASISQEFNNGDGIMTRHIGGDIYVYYYNGTIWSLLATRSDSTYTAAGYSGLLIDNTAGRLDNFGAGAYVPAPSTIRGDFVPHMQNSPMRLGRR